MHLPAAVDCPKRKHFHWWSRLHSATRYPICCPSSRVNLVLGGTDQQKDSTLTRRWQANGLGWCNFSWSETKMPLRVIRKRRYRWLKKRFDTMTKLQCICFIGFKEKPSIWLCKILLLQIWKIINDWILFKEKPSAARGLRRVQQHGKLFVKHYFSFAQVG